MKTLAMLTLFLLVLVILFAGVNNPDKPLKGEWNFKLHEVWTVDSAGENLITDLGPFVVSDDGTCYVKDLKNKTNYIFDKDGKFLKSFGNRGEGPGEVKNAAGMFFVNGNVIIIDIDKIHYFTAGGKYLNSIHNNLFARRPACFLNQDEFISITQIPASRPGGKGKILKYNLKTQKETLLREFTFYKGGIVDTDAGTFVMIVESLTPAMILGYDDGTASGKKGIYSGMNHTYELDAADLNGKILNTLSLDRKKTKISRDDKLERWKNRPKDRQEMIIKSTPNELNYFIRLEVHNGLIYTYISDLNRANRQKIDIFSPQGKYLYRAVIDVGTELTFSNPQRYNPIIKGSYLYAAVEDEEGQVMIKKYKIQLPKL
jgi:hypothetical protein